MALRKAFRVRHHDVPVEYTRSWQRLGASLVRYLQLSWFTVETREVKLEVAGSVCPAVSEFGVYLGPF